MATPLTRMPAPPARLRLVATRMLPSSADLAADAPPKPLSALPVRPTQTRHLVSRRNSA